MPATSTNRDALRLELKEIISTDAQAADIMRKAKEKRREIEETSGKKRQQILEQAQQEIARLTEEVRLEQQQLASQRQAKAVEEHKRQQKALQKEMDDNHDRYVEEIFGRMITTEG